MTGHGGEQLPKKRKRVRKKTSDGIDVKLLLYRALDLLKRREQRGIRKDVNLSGRQKRIFLEIRNLKMSTEAIKIAGMNLIRSSVVAALGFHTKRMPKYVGGGIETEKERHLRIMLKLRALEEKNREMAKTTREQNILGYKEKVPISIYNRGTRQLFVCIICNEEFDVEASLKTHFVYHTESAVFAAKERLAVLTKANGAEKDDIEYRVVTVFKCELCPKKFFARTVYKNHVMEVHKENRELIDKICFPCSFCDQVFNGKNKLDLHQREVHEVFTRCPICDEDIKTQELFYKHLKESHPCYSENSKEQVIYGYAKGYFCKVCGWSSNSYSRVMSHAAEHSRSKRLQCDVCQQEFNEVRNLNEHKESRHGEKTCCCEVCGKSYSNKRLLRVHLRIHKENSKKSVQCTKCGKTFASIVTLNVHDIAVHQKKRSWQCNVCGKTFTCGPSLHIHKTTTCEKEKATPRICPICGKSLDNYILLCHHKANFHKFGNTEENVCHLCNKTLKDPFTLYNHNRNYHLSGLPNNQPNELTCAVCNKKRPNRISLLEHWRKHRDERPFKCNLCETVFKYATRFFQHKKSAHKNELDKAKMIIDKETQMKLKEDFKIVHADQFLKNDRNRPNIVPKADERQTLDNTSNHNDVGREDQSLNINEINSNRPLVTSVVVAEENDGKIFIDFSRANCPVVEALQQKDNADTPNYCESKADGGKNMDANRKPEINLRQDNNTEEEDEFTDSTDGLFCPPSPIDYSDNEITTKEETPDYNNPTHSSSTKELILKIDRLKECLVCNKYFPTSGQQKEHLASKDHQMNVKKNKKVVAKGDRKTKRRQKKSHVDEEKLYPCPLCTEIFADIGKYRSHLAKHKNRVSCLLCTEKFTTVRKLVDHYISDHEGEKVEKCDICDKGFLNYRIASNNNELLRHKERQHGQIKPKRVKSERNYFCDMCGEKCLGGTLFRTHLLSHNDDKHKCVHCPEEFRRLIELENHYNETHNGEMPFSCNKCSQRFIAEFRLQLHKKEAHSKDKEVVCDVCGKAFLRPSELKKHRDRHDPVEERRKYICDFCGKQFLKNDSLLIHRKSHTREDLFPCTLCGKDVAFISKIILKEHMDRVHNENGYVCDFCGKSFTNRKCMNSHRKMHFPENAKPCSHCSKIFYTVKDLNRHIKRVCSTETKTSPTFACELCPLKFHRPDGLKKHSELHDPARPLGCDQCSWRFNHASNLHFHKKNVHEKMGIVYAKKKKINTD